MIAGKRLKVLRAHIADNEAVSNNAVGVINQGGVLRCTEGALQFDEVQPDGKKSMMASAWLSGVRGDVVLDA